MSDAGAAVTINSDAGGTTVVNPDGTNPTAPVVTPNDGSMNDWTSTLPETAKAYVTQKGFKDAAAVLDSYQNLEKLMGAPKERIVKLPEKADAPEWAEVYDKLGRPKNATDYKFTAPEGGEVNKDFAAWAQKEFHSLGLTRSQGETLASKWNEYAMNLQKGDQEAYNAQLKVDTDALKREWGAAYNQNLKAGQKAAQMFGIGKEEIAKLEQALGYSATLKFLSNVGSKIGEAEFVDGSMGDGFKGAMTPAQAIAQVETLKKDQDFVRRYLANETAAKIQMETLLKFANPETDPQF